MIVHNCKQGSGEWLKLRLGIPTASELDALVSPEGKVRTGAGPESYVYRKVCERLLGFGPDASSFAMEQGTILETEARPFYSVTRDIEVATPAFITTDDGRAGCSPDGLVGETGGLEIKCLQPENALRVLMENAVPKDYVVQVQMSLWVTGRDWWDFMSYSRQFPAVVIRVTPDDKLQSAIGEALSRFNERFDSILSKVTAMRDAENAQKTAAYYAAEGISPPATTN